MHPSIKHACLLMAAFWYHFFLTFKPMSPPWQTCTICLLATSQLLTGDIRQGGSADVSASVPAMSGDIDVEGAMPSADVDAPSASASLDAPGEKGCIKSPTYVPCLWLLL